MPNSKKSGFSLVELAIVLVIMGFLASAVVVGQELINNAKLRAIIGEFETYKLAIDNFKTQYEGLPGDLSNSESFFGTYNDPANLDGTLNGDGNGKIDPNETFTAWHQLFRARLISGTYRGGDTSADDAVIGTNVPGSQHLLAGFSLTYSVSPGGFVDSLGRGFPDNYLLLGNETVGSYLLTTGSLLPEEAASIDNKIDNDQPDFGNVLAVNGNGTTNCTTAIGPLDAEYKYANTSENACVLYVKFQ